MTNTIYTKVQDKEEEEVGDVEKAIGPQKNREITSFDNSSKKFMGNSQVVQNISSNVEENHSESVHDFELETGSPWQLKLKVLIFQAIPIMVSFFMGLGGGFINLMFAGSYSYNGNPSVVFAAVSLSNMFCNVTFVSLLVGLSTAIETLGSQYNGAKNYKEVGIVLQRAMLILSGLTVPVAFVWLNGATVFRMLGVEKDVCDVIRHYVRVRLFTMPGDVFYVSFEKYLMSIGVVQPTLIDSFAFNIMIITFNSLFVHYFKFSYICLAWSWVLASYLRIVVQLTLSLRYEEVKRTLQPPSREAFTNLYDFISLGIPGTVMLCSEWWAYEILTIFASFLGTEKLAAQAIILQTASLMYMIPLGMGIATASLVGNALGANKKELAIDISNLALKSILVLQLAVVFMITFFGKYFVYSFTNDPIVQHIASLAMPLLAIFTMFDALQGVSSGILRGAGKQKIGAVANVFAFYAIGLPMAWIMTFVLKMGVNGLLVGFSFGVVFQVAVLLLLVKCRQDYVFSSLLDDEVKETKETKEASHKKETIKESSKKVKNRAIVISPLLSVLQLSRYKKVRMNSSDSTFTIDDSYDDEDDEVNEIIF